MRDGPEVPASVTTVRRTIRRSHTLVGYCHRMLDATTRSGGIATASPQAATKLTDAPAAAVAPLAFTARCTRALLSPWSRLSLLVVLLATAASCVLLFEPQKLL